MLFVSSYVLLTLTQVIAFRGLTWDISESTTNFSTNVWFPLNKGLDDSANKIKWSLLFPYRGPSVTSLFN